MLAIVLPAANYTAIGWLVEAILTKGEVDLRFKFISQSAVLSLTTGIVDNPITASNPITSSVYLATTKKLILYFTYINCLDQHQQINEFHFWFQYRHSPCTKEHKPSESWTHNSCLPSRSSKSRMLVTPSLTLVGSFQVGMINSSWWTSARVGELRWLRSVPRQLRHRIFVLLSL